MKVNFQSDKIDHQQWFVDVACKTGVELPGFSALWKTCCLTKFIETLRREEEGSKCEETLYPFCYTQECGGITSAPRQGNACRMGGLVYSQNYWTGKNQLDANKMCVTLVLVHAFTNPKVVRSPQTRICCWGVTEKGMSRIERNPRATI
jgi:hypothetical protein